MHSIPVRRSPDRDSAITDAKVPARTLSTIQQEFCKIVESGKRMRYNDLSGVHNPWGKAVHFFDSWKLLEVCQSPFLLDLVAEVIGTDIILWDSRFFSLAPFVSTGGWIRESDFSPFEELEGVTIRIPVGSSDLKIAVPSDMSAGETARSLVIKSGRSACHDVHLPYRYEHTESDSHRGEYIIQYASGNSRFVRDQSSIVQRSLADRLPLINFGRAPIWLLQGIDHVQNDFVTGFAPTVVQWTDAKW